MADNKVIHFSALYLQVISRKTGGQFDRPFLFYISNALLQLCNFVEKCTCVKLKFLNVFFKVIKLIDDDFSSPIQIFILRVECSSE